MFTGIIKNKAKIISIKNGNFIVENIFEREFQSGQSIAHDGACMTIINITDNNYTFFVMEETLKKTNFGNKKSGDFFNVEDSLKLSDGLDGHFVTGHVDGIGLVTKVEINKDNSKDIYIEFDKKFTNLLIDKGSIAINGVSLTVIDAKQNSFYVSLIPLTQEITNLGLLKIGDNVNLEFDMIGKYINKIYTK